MVLKFRLLKPEVGPSAAAVVVTEVLGGKRLMGGPAVGQGGGAYAIQIDNILSFLFAIRRRFRRFTVDRVFPICALPGTR